MRIFPPARCMECSFPAICRKSLQTSFPAFLPGKSSESGRARSERSSAVYPGPPLRQPGAVGRNGIRGGKQCSAGIEAIPKKLFGRNGSGRKRRDRLCCRSTSLVSEKDPEDRARTAYGTLSLQRRPVYGVGLTPDGIWSSLKPFGQRRKRALFSGCWIKQKRLWENG